LSSDASATYRGYRKQALYVLWRLVRDASGRHVYRPEGGEDLAVFDDRRLVEVVQVKAYSSALTLSSFNPSSPGGFFARMRVRRAEHPECVHSLATFGPVGTELLGALRREEPHHSTVVRKLCTANPSIVPSEAAVLLDALAPGISRPVEEELREEILGSLSGTISGADPSVGLQLLLFWVFQASERRRDLTRGLLLSQIERIGAFLATLRDSAAEWMNALTPVREETLSDEERTQLRSEYVQGVQARWRHILADADCARPERLAEIREKLHRHAVVVVRGASGQGKSSLGWRYLREYSTDGLRFHVRLVDGRIHALRIANALRAHVQSLRLPAVVYLDISPSDTGWIELVRQLADSNLKVLVAVREEDFRRAGVPLGEIDVGEVVLERIGYEEARAIFAALATSGNASANTLDFEDAWANFTSGEGGPLLEFTYLAAQGQSLSARVDAQIARIQAEVASERGLLTAKHLRLLAVCALANAAGCRVDLDRLCVAVGMDPLSRPLAFFEQEYLLRLSEEGSRSSVATLHALRSKAVLAALLRDSPAAWSELAQMALPLVLDEDCEALVISCFSDFPECDVMLEDAVRAVPLRTWTQAGGIARALLWEGVSRFERQNHTVLAEVLSRYGPGWWLLCEALPVDTEEARAEVLGVLSKMSGGEPPKIVLTSRKGIFAPYVRWVLQAHAPAAGPFLPTDWSCAGDVAFWIGLCGVQCELRNALEQMRPVPLPERATLAQLGTFILGMHALGHVAFATWHAQVAPEIVSRYLFETESVHLEDDGESVKVYFPIVTSADGRNTQAASDWHGQTMKRINLLRLLFPQRTLFASQSLGLEVLGELMPHDPTTKEIPAKNLPAPQGVHLNALLLGLVSYRHRRSKSWTAYVNYATDFREAVCRFLRQLLAAWERMLAERSVQTRSRKLFPADALAEVQGLPGAPMLPRSAVDQWGFVSEGKDISVNTPIGKPERWDSLARFRLWLKSFSKFESATLQMAQCATPATRRHISVKEGRADENVTDKDGHLFLANMEQAWLVLPTMQGEFQRLFAARAPASAATLDAQEKELFRKLWFVAFAFIREPLRRRSRAAAYLDGEMKARRGEFLAQASDEVHRVLGTGGGAQFIERCMLGGVPCLLVVCEHATVASIEPSRKLVVQALSRAARAHAWSLYEWTPIVVEWEQVVVVHTVKGRAIAPAGSAISTHVLFGAQDTFEPKPHHVLDSPIDEGELAAVGVVIWDTPLIRAIVAWQAALVTFALVALRGDIVATFVEERGIPDALLRSVETAFTQELTVGLGVLMDAHDALVAVLAALAESDTPEAEFPRSRLQTLLNWTASSRPGTAIGRDAAPAYVSLFIRSSGEINDFVREMVDWGTGGSVTLAL
jgi:hypothetical protein